MPNYFRVPNTVLVDQSDTCKVSSSDVLSVAPQDKFEAISVTRSAYEEQTEFYLHIKIKPLSSRIESINVLDNEEVKEQQEASDDLLNIYLPLTRSVEIKKNKKVFERPDLKTNFLYLPDNKDRPLSFYFDSDSVHFTGHEITVSGLELDEEENQVVNSGALSFPIIKPASSKKIKEGQTLYLNIDGRIYHEPFEYDGEGGFLLLDYDQYVEIYKIELTVSSSKEQGKIQVFRNEYDNNFFDDIDNYKKSLEVNKRLSLVYPLGFVENGNFIHGRNPDNLVIYRDFTNMSYFKEIDQNEEGCDFEVFTARDEYFLAIN